MCCDLPNILSANSVVRVPDIQCCSCLMQKYAHFMSHHDEERWAQNDSISLSPPISMARFKDTTSRLELCALVLCKKCSSHPFDIRTRGRDSDYYVSHLCMRTCYEHHCLRPLVTKSAKVCCSRERCLAGPSFCSLLALAPWLSF